MIADVPATVIADMAISVHANTEYGSGSDAHQIK